MLGNQATCRMMIKGAQVGTGCSLSFVRKSTLRAPALETPGASAQ